METPNLFSIATSELSQDAFIVWLIQWADDAYSNVDSELNITAKKFVSSLLNERTGETDIEIKKTIAGRQLNNIDIWADINDKYFIIIEDKVNTDEHSNQLDRYTNFVNETYGDSREIVRIYFKTGLESQSKIHEIQKCGWKYFSRDDFLDVLNASNSTNDILVSYREHLSELKKQSLSYDSFSNLDNSEATKGLFIEIEKFLSAKSVYYDWGYVSNPNGGFMGLWAGFLPCRSNQKIEFYFQIENYNHKKINLMIKVCGEWNGKTRYLYDSLSKLQKTAEKYGLSLKKPARFHVGNYTSVAVVENAFNKLDDGRLDIENLYNVLNKTLEMLHEFVAEM